MKQTILPVLTAALGLLVITPDPARADTAAKLNVSGTTYIQGEGAWLGDIYTAKIDKVRINTKDMLLLFAEALDRPEFPRGSYITVSAGFRVTVNFQGQELADVTPYFVISVDEAFDDLEQVRFNDLTKQETSQFMYPMSIRVGTEPAPLAAEGGSLDDNSSGVELFLSGIAFETFKAGAVSQGLQRVSLGLTTNVSGDGSVDSIPAIFVGKITARGSGVDQYTLE